MKTLTVRLPEAMAAEIETEARTACISKSDVVRRRLEATAPLRGAALFDLATGLIGSLDDASVPRDLSSRKKGYLKKRGYGKNNPR